MSESAAAARGPAPRSPARHAAAGPWGLRARLPASEPASLGRRLAAGLVDLGIGWLLVGIAVYATVPEVENETLTRSQEESVGIATLIAMSVWVNYLVFAEWRYGRTIGKAALGLRVVRLDGTKLSWNAALVRNLLRLPDLIAIFFTVPTSEHRQRLGDRAAKTVVLRVARAGAAGGALRGART